MLNCSIYLDKASEKYIFMDIIRTAGAIITDVSGCGSGYHISFDATPAQNIRINRMWGAV